MVRLAAAVPHADLNSRCIPTQKYTTLTDSAAIFSPRPFARLALSRDMTTTVD